jgi:hypothetical protein
MKPKRGNAKTDKSFSETGNVINVHDRRGFTIENFNLKTTQYDRITNNIF